MSETDEKERSPKLTTRRKTKQKTTPGDSLSDSTREDSVGNVPKEKRASPIHSPIVLSQKPNQHKILRRASSNARTKKQEEKFHIPTSASTGAPPTIFSARGPATKKMRQDSLERRKTASDTSGKRNTSLNTSPMKSPKSRRLETEKRSYSRPETAEHKSKSSATEKKIQSY